MVIFPLYPPAQDTYFLQVTSASTWDKINLKMKPYTHPKYRNKLCILLLVKPQKKRVLEGPKYAIILQQGSPKIPAKLWELFKLKQTTRNFTSNQSIQFDYIKHLYVQLKFYWFENIVNLPYHFLIWMHEILSQIIWEVLRILTCPFYDLVTSLQK
jgi:hypothetical protein